MKGLRKRDNVWHIDISVKNGSRFRKSLRTGDKPLAERIYHSIKLAIAEGRWFDTTPAHDRHTVDELFDRYLAEVSINKTDASQCRDRQIVARMRPEFGQLFLPYKEGKEADEITSAHFAHYKDKRRRDGAANATINKELSVPRSAFTVAVCEWKWCSINPLATVKPLPVKATILRWLTLDEEDLLLADIPLRVHRTLCVLLDTGMRLSELLRLRCADIDLFRKETTVRMSKNEKPRVIPMTTRVHRLFVEMGVGTRKGRADLVFTTAKGTALSPRNVKRDVRNAVKKARIEHISIHGMRHTFGSRLAQADVHILKIQQLMGHKDIRSTQRYAHLSTKSLSVQALERAS